MSILTIHADRSGVSRVVATVRSVSESSVAAEAMQAAALPLKLLSDTLRAHFAGQAVTQNADVTYGAKALDMYVCACGERFHDAEGAVSHVENDHASPRIRRDINKIEAIIETLITPSPLAPALEPTEIVPTRTFENELIEELTALFGDRSRAESLVRYAGWDKFKGICYDEVKEEIVLAENCSTNKISKRKTEDFLKAYALLLSQVGGVLKA